jgi:hypothetical protein
MGLNLYRYVTEVYAEGEFGVGPLVGTSGEQDLKGSFGSGAGGGGLSVSALMVGSAGRRSCAGVNLLIS